MWREDSRPGGAAPERSQSSRSAGALPVVCRSRPMPCRYREPGQCLGRIAIVVGNEYAQATRDRHGSVRHRKPHSDDGHVCALTRMGPRVKGRVPLVRLSQLT
jgi:hypothetical protein